MIELKTGVRLDNLFPQMLVALAVVQDVFAESGYEITITSGSEGQHSRTSLHYLGAALDFRTRDINVEDRGALARSIRIALGENFDVVLENTHLHVEYQPKGPAQ